MKFRSTAILAVIFIALLGYVYYSQTRSAGPGGALPTPSATPVAVFNFLTDNVTRLQATDLQKNQSVVVARQGQDWHMEQPKDSATDPLKIATALGDLAHLEATRVLTNATDLSAYGLVTGTVEARITMSDTTQFAIKFGDETIDKSSAYALKGDDKATVYVVSASVLESLRSFVAQPPYPPTATPTPLPTATPSITPTLGPTTEGTPAVGPPAPAASPPAGSPTP